MDVDDQKLDSRVCSICGGKMLAPVLHDRKKHNCLTIPGLDKNALPATCLVDENNPLSRDIFSSILAYQYRAQQYEAIHKERVALAKDIFELTKDGLQNEKSLLKLADNYDIKKIRHFNKKLPTGSPLIHPISLLIRALASKKKPEKKVIKKQEDIALPEEFEKAIQLYKEKSERILQIKQQHGYEYSPNTVVARINRARRFCEFIAEQGLTQWPQVGQCHLDDYICQRNKGAGVGAYTFLVFIKSKFKMTQKFKRPKTPKKPPAEAINDYRKIPDILKKIAVHPELEVKVAALFITLFAQTITRIAKLKIGDFRRIDKKLEVLLAEDWVVLDNLTESLICEIDPSLLKNFWGNHDRLLFTMSRLEIMPKVGKLTGVDLKQLRLGAVANLIHSGVTDRITIWRSLGVSLPTIAYVEKVFQWDLHSTVPAQVIKSRNEVIRGERTE